MEYLYHLQNPGRKYRREPERFLESDPEMLSLEAEIHHYIDILEPVLRDAGQEMWQALDRIISAKNAMEGIVAKEMYIRGFLDYERLVVKKIVTFENRNKEE